MFMWDKGKRQSNIAKHGVDFELVERMDWDFALIVNDDRHAYSEIRFNVLLPYAGRLFNLVVSFQTAGVRVISARKANKREIAKWRQGYDS